MSAKRLARKGDPITSHIAASQVAMFGEVQDKTITDALVFGPASIHEIAARTGYKLDHVQVARRLPQMARLDAPPVEVVEGETRPSPTGRPCRVWRLRRS